MQVVVVCVVLAGTIGVAGAAWYENNYPTDLVITAANPQPWGAEWVYIASANLVNGAGVWDSTVIVASDGVVTSDRVYVGTGSPLVSGRLIIDGGSWTASSVLHVANYGPDGSGPDEINLVEVNNGGTLSIQGLELGIRGLATMTVDNSTLTNSGAAYITTAAGGGSGVLTIRNGGTGGGGLTSMERGTGATSSATLNVDGAGSLWNGHTFYMGGATCTASLNITNGGTVLADNFNVAQGAAACDITIPRGRRLRYYDQRRQLLAEPRLRRGYRHGGQRAGHHGRGRHVLSR